jgi:tetratricopeptide (TPR) repeat protein
VYHRRSSGEVVSVEARYRTGADGVLRLQLGGYDPAIRLTVDPTISFAAYLGGTGADTCVAIARDSQGFVYLAGNTDSTDFPTPANTGYQVFDHGNQDAWLMKLNPAPASGEPVIVYSTYFGGTAAETLTAMTVDASSGIVYVTGSTASSDFPTTSRAYRASITAGTNHVFVSVFDPSQSGAAGLIYSGSFFGELNMLAYSREQEARADEAAVTYLEKAGYSAEGIVDFFNYFRYQEVFSDIKKFPYFIDHPLSDDRIEALQNRARAQSHYGVKDTPEAIAEYTIMKAKLQGFLNRPFQTFAEVPETDTSFAARYARAIAYYKELETDKALKAIDGLIADRPDDPYLYELKGQTLMESARAVEAEEPLRKAVALKPDAPLLRILLAEDLLSEDNHAKLDDAIVDLNRSLVVEADNPIAWQYLSEAYDSKSMPGMARLATAEQNFNLGQLKDAAVFAIRARQLLKKDTPEWRRATDIVLASKPSPEVMKALGEAG